MKNFQVGDVVRLFSTDILFDCKVLSIFENKCELEISGACDFYPNENCELVSREGYELSLVEKARLFARTRHHGQFRRDNKNSFADQYGACELKVPYFTHCEKVASLVDTDFEKAVAFCHDLIEDGKATEDELIENVSHNVHDVVSNLTHYKHEPYDEYIKDIQTRVYSHDSVVVRVKIADIVANLSDSPTQRQIEKYNKALRILAGV